MRPRLLDLFCGAGGAAMGYHRAGFDVTGVDIKPQPRYPFPFIQGDALEYVAAHGHEYDVIHASPPCQGYSIMRNLPWLRGKEYPMLITPTRELLNASGRPWCIENVMGAKLAAGWLCGQMFGLPFFRHRYFESSGDWIWLQPSHEPHRTVISSSRHLGSRARDIVASASRRGPELTRKFVYSDAEDSRGLRTWPGRREDAGHGITIVGHGPQSRRAAVVMGVDWMRRDEATQAIPPAYTELIGRQLLAAVEAHA